MTEDLQMAYNVSIVGCSQLILSTQILKSEAILDQWVQAQTNHLTAKTAEFRQLVIEMKSHMDGTYTLFY